MNRFIKTGVDYVDRNKMRVSVYVKEFAGHETPFKSRSKLTGSKKNKQRKTVQYQINGGDWVSTEDAIAMVKSGELDAVVVTAATGTVFLRTRPDDSTTNNLG